MFHKLIASSISPNTESDDVWRAILLLFSPWQWQRGAAIQAVEQWFENYFNAGTVVAFNSGRSAFYTILSAFGIGAGDEVILQAFTCVAVPEVILWVGAKPIYVDIYPDTFNIDPSELEKKITQNTKAIVVQHTFGIPADIIRVKKIARKHNLFLIEDCAHSLGARVLGKKVGTFGDAAFFSFGRDKIISSVFGGVAIIAQNSKFNMQNYSEKLKSIHAKLPYSSTMWILQQLLHPIIMMLIIIPLYNIFGIGKLILVICQKLRLLSFPVYVVEQTGARPAIFPARLPNALACLALVQLSKLEQFNKKRYAISSRYGHVMQGAVYLRYPYQTDNPDLLKAAARKNGILLGIWYAHVIDPNGVDLHAVGYMMGSCPRAEYAGKHLVNLPTYPRMNDSDVCRVRDIVQNHSGTP